MNEEIERKVPQTFSEYFQATREAVEVFRWIFKHVVTQKSVRWMWQMTASIVFMIIMQTIQPAGISYVFNGLAKHDGSMAVWGLGIFCGALLLHKISQYHYDRSREWVFGLHWAKIDEVVTRLFFEKSLAQHSMESNLLAPTTIDKGRMKAMDLQRILFFDAFPVVLQLLLSFVCLCYLSWIAGLIMAAVIAIYLLWSLYLNSEVSRVCTPLDKLFRRLGRRRNERMERIERVKVSSMEEREVDEMSATFEDILHQDRSFWLHFIDIAFIRSMLNALGLVSIMAWGAWLVWRGELNIGLLYPLYTWATRVSENVWRLGDVEHQINWNIPPVQSMIKAVTMVPTIEDKKGAIKIDPMVSQRVEFNDVSHTYPGGAPDKESPPALCKVNFVIKPGEKVALLGSSGSGKSTLMKKLLRFDDPTEGSIKINGVDLRDITQESWRSCIGYIPQQAQVFDGSIRYNLTFGLNAKERKAMTDEKLWDLMKLLQIDFGERLTEGLDTVVGRNGIKLSGGQAQRLMIGAAVVKNPRILVIDEATSSLDSTTEKLVQQGLETVLASRETSALIVAHRLSTVRHLCDKFVVLKPVSQVATGESQVEAIAHSFEELYRLSPTFRQLADDQGILIEAQELVA